MAEQEHVPMIELVISSFEGRVLSNFEKENLLKLLSFLPFPDQVDNALQILDDRGLRLLETPSGRRIHTACGNRKQYYVCPYHCSCESYFQMAKRTSRDVVCKHILALKLAPLFDAVDVVQVSDQELIAVMSG